MNLQVMIAALLVIAMAGLAVQQFGEKDSPDNAYNSASNAASN
jgi:hypothetical protein